MHIALLGTVPAIGRAVRPELHIALPDGARLTAWPSRAGVFPASPIERDIQAIGHFEAGLRAAAQGADAVVIDSVGDYGLDALRAGLGIPATGAGECGMAAAAALGRFAIVTVWPASMNFVPEALLRGHGHEDRCIGIYNVGTEAVLGRIAGPDGYLARVGDAEPALLAAVVDAVARAAADGADAVMLGCSCMSPMAAQVAAAVTIPVINPLLEATVQAVRRVAASGPATAPVTTGRGMLVTRMMDAIGDEADEDCPVCIMGTSDGRG